jgi:hypothetical protein
MYSGSAVMQTPNELRFQAQNCLELANRTHEIYAREALTELAHKFKREARQAERRERDMAIYSEVRAHAR